MARQGNARSHTMRASEKLSEADNPSQKTRAMVSSAESGICTRNAARILGDGADALLGSGRVLKVQVNDLYLVLGNQRLGQP